MVSKMTKKDQKRIKIALDRIRDIDDPIKPQAEEIEELVEEVLSWRSDNYDRQIAGMH